MNTEYIDSLDELAYITSLEQQNIELLAALALINANAAESPEWIRARIAPILAKSDRSLWVATQ